MYLELEELDRLRSIMGFANSLGTDLLTMHITVTDRNGDTVGEVRAQQITDDDAEYIFYPWFECE